jgi:hypothetical protein
MFRKVGAALAALVLLAVASQAQLQAPQITSVTGSGFQGDTLFVNGINFRDGAGTFGKVRVSNTRDFLLSSEQTVPSWTDTLLKVMFAAPADTLTSNYYMTVTDSIGYQGPQFSLTNFSVIVEAPDSVGTGDTLTVDYKVYATGPWVAGWFKTYYDSVALTPFRYIPPDTFSCKAEFDDLYSGVGPYVNTADSTFFADADIWLMREGTMAKHDTVTIGSVQFIADSSVALAPIFASPENRAPHPLGIGGRNSYGCMDCPWDMYEAQSEAVLVQKDNNYATPGQAQWTSVQDSVEITGNFADHCTGNWDEHPPKEGGLSSGTQCAPFAIILTAADSAVTAGDSLDLEINVWCDSVNSVRMFFEYSPTCGPTEDLTNIYAGAVMESTDFDSFYVHMDWQYDYLPRCSDLWPATIDVRNKIMYVKFWTFDESPVSHAGKLLTVKLADGGCQETFSIGPSDCGHQGYYNANLAHSYFESGNPPHTRGGTYIYEQTRSPWVRWVYIQGLPQYTFGN